MVFYIASYTIRAFAKKCFVVGGRKSAYAMRVQTDVFFRELIIIFKLVRVWAKKRAHAIFCTLRNSRLINLAREIDFFSCCFNIFNPFIGLTHTKSLFV